MPPAARSGVVAIATGLFRSVALKEDGSVVVWGACNSVYIGQCPVPAAVTSGVTAIAAGPYQQLALRRDGSVVAWGCDIGDLGQCTVPAGAGSGVTAIAAGVHHSLALSGGTQLLPCTAPNVVGKAVPAAKRAITRSHCRTGRVRSAYSRKRKPGVVTSQSPSPGRVLPPYSKIDLVVSRGPKR